MLITPLTAAGASTTGPARRKRTCDAPTPEIAHLLQADLGAKRQRKNSLPTSVVATVAASPNQRNCPSPGTQKTKAALSKRQKDTHEKRAVKLGSREVLHRSIFTRSRGQ